MDVQGTFSQGARPLARLKFGFSGTPQRALLFLSVAAFTTSTFLNSLSSYPTFKSATQKENSENCYEGTFIQSAQPLARLGFDGASVFLEAFSLLFPRGGVNPVHLLQLVLELTHFPLGLPMDHHWLTTLCRLHGISCVEPMY